MESFEHRRADLLEGRTRSHNYIEVQLHLMAELWSREHRTFTEPDHETREVMAHHWIKNGYAAAFGGLVKQRGFKEHPRFQGDYTNIMLSDLDYFLEHDSLPER